MKKADNKNKNNDEALEKSFESIARAGDKGRGILIDAFKGLSVVETITTVAPIIQKGLTGVPYLSSFVALIGGLFKIIYTLVTKPKDIPAVVETILFQGAYSATGLIGLGLSAAATYTPVIKSTIDTGHHYYLFWDTWAYFLFSREYKGDKRLLKTYTDSLEKNKRDYPDLYSLYMESLNNKEPINQLLKKKKLELKPDEMKMVYQIGELHHSQIEIKNKINAKRNERFDRAEDLILGGISTTGFALILAGHLVLPFTFPLAVVGGILVLSASIWGFMSKAEINPFKYLIKKAMGISAPSNNEKISIESKPEVTNEIIYERRCEPEHIETAAHMPVVNQIEAIPIEVDREDAIEVEREDEEIPTISTPRENTKDTHSLVKNKLYEVTKEVEADIEAPEVKDDIQASSKKRLGNIPPSRSEPDVSTKGLLKLTDFAQSNFFSQSRSNPNLNLHTFRRKRAY